MKSKKIKTKLISWSFLILKILKMENSNLITDDYLRGVLKIIEGLNLILKTNNFNATVCLGTAEEQEQILKKLIQSLST